MIYIKKNYFLKIIIFVLKLVKVWCFDVIILGMMEVNYRFNSYIWLMIVKLL